MSTRIVTKYEATCKDCGATLPVGSKARYYGYGHIYGTTCHDKPTQAVPSPETLGTEIVTTVAEEEEPPIMAAPTTITRPRREINLASELPADQSEKLQHEINKAAAWERKPKSRMRSVWCGVRIYGHLNKLGGWAGNYSESLPTGGNSCYVGWHKDTPSDLDMVKYQRDLKAMGDTIRERWHASCVPSTNQTAA